MAKKNKKSIGKKQITDCGKNYWKLVAILFILIFAVLLIFSLMRAYHFKASFSSATPEQVKTAQDIVSFELKKNNDDLANYDVRVINRIKHVQKKDTLANILQVSLKNNSISQVYLIDVDAKSVVMYSKTEFYGDTVSVGHLEGRRDFSVFKKVWGAK